jgi:hypothetical protein
MKRKFMSKNLTRKGLALGALVALASTVIAGTPATAAGEINVAPAAGTSYNAVAGSVYNLVTTLAPGYTPSSYAQLKYIVKTDANSAIVYGRGVAAVTAPATSQAVSTTSAALAATGADATTVNYLGLQASVATVSSSVEVTAFVDANNDGAVTAGEWNTVRTVAFKKLADITPVVTLTQPKTGDTTVSATVAWGDLNTQQAGVGVVATGAANSKLGVEFKKNSGSYAAATAYNSTTGAFTQSQTIADSDVVYAQAVWATNPYTSTTDSYSSSVIGSAVSGTAAVRTISSLTGAVVAGNDATSAGVVRTNGSFVAKVTALNTASTPVAAAAVPVVATFATSATLVPASTGVTEKSVTVNGTKYTTNAALTAASVALTTDASGVATVSVSSSGLVATNTITVSFAAQNRTGSAVATQTDAAYTVSDDANSAVIATTKNTATTLNYSVKDQFGVLSTRTNERLVVTANTAATVTQYITVTAGKAAIVVTPVTDSTADITVIAALQVSTTDPATGVTWAANGTNVANRTVKIRAAAYDFATAPAVAYVWNGSASAAYNSTSNYKQALTTAALADLAAVTSGAANATWQAVTLTGSNAGEKLTVSGTGVFLSIDGATATANSATQIAQAAAATIYVASNTTGAKTLTVTNGTVSKTVVVTFDKAAATAGKTITIGDLAVQAQAGRAVDVSAVITDKFGNPVQGATVTLTSSGVGYLGNNSVTTSDASGRVTAKLIVDSGDLGTATVTASSTLADATVATASKSVEFGQTDVDVTTGGKALYASVEFAKGKTVTVTVDGKRLYSKMFTTDSYTELKFTQKIAGKHVVTIRVSGGVSLTETVVTTK